MVSLICVRDYSDSPGSCGTRNLVTEMSVAVSLVYTKSGQGEKRKSGESGLANVVFTGDGFSLNLGFINIFCSQTMDSVLFQVS